MEKELKITSLAAFQENGVYGRTQLVQKNGFLVLLPRQKKLPHPCTMVRGRKMIIQKRKGKTVQSCLE